MVSALLIIQSLYYFFGSISYFFVDDREIEYFYPWATDYAMFCILFLMFFYKLESKIIWSIGEFWVFEIRWTEYVFFVWSVLVLKVQPIIGIKLMELF